MKTWVDRFFALNKESEVEFTGVCFSHVFRGLDALGWKLDDEFWAPDMQVSRFLRGVSEIFVIQETYFDPKLTGGDHDIEALRAFISGIGPNEVLYAGARPIQPNEEAEQVSRGNGGQRP
jgi:hypothetical protein